MQTPLVSRTHLSDGRKPRDGQSAPRVLIALAALFLSTACTVKIPVIDLYPITPTAESSSDLPVTATLGVVPLADQRPETQHTGEKPRLWVFLLYNQRKGTYLTGDEHFTRPPALAVSDALVEALDGARFGRSRLLDREPSRRVADGLDACANEDLKYVGLGSVDSLYGTIEQSAYFGFLPIPYLTLIGWGNSTSDPLGVIQLDLEILECATRESVYQRRIVRQLRYPEESPTEAVRFALYDILEQIRNETTRR